MTAYGFPRLTSLADVERVLAGFGLCTPAGPHTLSCDVGIRVCPSHQRQGLGAWIVQRMAARAREQGLIPTAGCAVDNAISRRTLERAGFVADHRLLQFALGASTQEVCKRTSSPPLR